MVKTIGVYMIEHIDTGRRYIGKSVDVCGRVRCHFSPRAAATGYLSKAVSKYGRDAFVWHLIEKCPDDATAIAREIYWIATLGTRAPNGFNMTDGGEGLSGLSRSDHTKSLLSKALTGRGKSPETRARMAKAATGRRMSEAARQKVSSARQSMTEETREKMRASALARGRRYNV